MAPLEQIADIRYQIADSRSQITEQHLQPAGSARSTEPTHSQTHRLCLHAHPQGNSTAHSALWRVSLIPKATRFASALHPALLINSTTLVLIFFYLYILFPFPSSPSPYTYCILRSLLSSPLPRGRSFLFYTRFQFLLLYYMSILHLIYMHLCLFSLYFRLTRTRFLLTNLLVSTDTVDMFFTFE